MVDEIAMREVLSTLFFLIFVAAHSAIMAVWVRYSRPFGFEGDYFKAFQLTFACSVGILAIYTVVYFFKRL
jgi:hypothetical protein